MPQRLQRKPFSVFPIPLGLAVAVVPWSSVCGGMRAVAGTGFSVNNGDLVSLDGSASDGGDGAPLTYSWVQLPGGTPVSLTGANTSTPFFTAPKVAPGGETLAFLMTAGPGTSFATDTVCITVVNRNHPPVANAGGDQSVAEGSPVTLRGEGSFDIDRDVFSHTWTQVSGPAVALAGADSANPTFVSPSAGDAGFIGVVATLVFELRVDDGYPLDAPAPGYRFDDVIDTVTVRVTNTNNRPVADASSDQTVEEGTTVSLTGAGSVDPDGDSLTYSWVQESGGIRVALSGADTDSPSFVAPEVSEPVALVFTLTVRDGYGGTARSSVSVNILGRNAPPLADAAAPSVAVLWPPDHRLVSVGITGVSSAESPATITIDSVFQNEPTDGGGDGDTPIDAFIRQDGTVLLRAERAGEGDGRTYFVYFTATGPGGSDSGVVKVFVPHGNRQQKDKAGDGDALFDSTL